MRTAILLASVLALGLIVGYAAANDPKPPVEKLIFREAGFSIAPLDSQQKEPIQAVVMMFMAPSEGFAPNINILTQQFPDDIDKFAAVTKQQFEAMKLNVVSETKSDNKLEVAFEYTGNQKGVPMHWYARAVKKEGVVYLATGTSTEKQWPKAGARLKACVDSLQTLNAPQKQAALK